MKIVPHNTPKQQSLFDKLQENQPLPLLTSIQFNFPLSHIDVNGNPDNYIYHIPQWIIGLGSTQGSWSKLKKRMPDVFTSVQKVKFEGLDGKMYPTDFGTDKILYLIAENIQPKNPSPQLIAIQKYLALSGAAVDSARRNAEIPKTKIQVKLERDLALVKKVWSDNIEGITHIELEIKLAESLPIIRAIEKQVVDNPNYGDLMNAEYQGLFGYDAKGLKQFEGINNPRRDMWNQALASLHYLEQSIINTLSIVKRSGRTMSQKQAKDLYTTLSIAIRATHEKISETVGRHHVTGKPLLGSGK